MKIIAISTAAALLGAASSLSAHAQTGMPSEAKTGAPTTCVVPEPPVDSGQDAEMGSYARYLMLNGKSRERAIAEARNVDHPATSDYASRRAPRQTTVSAAADRVVQ